MSHTLIYQAPILPRCSRFLTTAVACIGGRVTVQAAGSPGTQAWGLPAVTLAGAMVTVRARGDSHYNSIAVDQCL